MGKTTQKIKIISKRSADSSNDEPIAKRLRKSTQTSFGIMLETLINNPGLQHIAENIFQYLDQHSLLKYRLVNSSWKRILDQPIFWLKKLGLAEKSSTYKYWKMMAQKFDSDDIVSRKDFALEIIHESIKLDKLHQEKVRNLKSRIKEVNKELKGAKKRMKEILRQINEINQAMITNNQLVKLKTHQE